ncbi:MAG: ABC transporter permease [Thaumarchaeota archaeon]|nr:ABC transporter permease [Nitrososphaerota archaeon]
MSILSRGRPIVSLFSTIFRTKAAKAGGLILAFLLLLILVGPLIVTYSPQAIVGLPNLPPEVAHPFGTDYQGHDVFSQLVWGSYPSLTLAFVSALGGSLLGFAAGVVSGYYRKAESVIAGATDVVLSFPTIPLLIIINVIFPGNDFIEALTLISVLWAPVSRAVRAQTLVVKRLSYIDAVRMSGMRDFKIIWKVLAFEVASIGMAFFIISLSVSVILVTALEFLGVGNPLHVTWGSILFWAQKYAFGFGDWWWVLAPGAVISLVAVSFALMGLSFEEIMNPRLRV